MFLRAYVDVLASHATSHGIAIPDAPDEINIRIWSSIRESLPPEVARSLPGLPGEGPVSGVAGSGHAAARAFRQGGSTEDTLTDPSTVAAEVLPCDVPVPSSSSASGNPVPMSACTGSSSRACDTLGSTDDVSGMSRADARGSSSSQAVASSSDRSRSQRGAYARLAAVVSNSTSGVSCPDTGERCGRSSNAAHVVASAPQSISMVSEITSGGGSDQSGDSSLRSRSGHGPRRGPVSFAVVERVAHDVAGEAASGSPE